MEISINGLTLPIPYRTPIEFLGGDEGNIPKDSLDLFNNMTLSEQVEFLRLQNNGFLAVIADEAREGRVIYHVSEHDDFHIARMGIIDDIGARLSVSELGCIGFERHPQSPSKRYKVGMEVSTHDMTGNSIFRKGDNRFGGEKVYFGNLELFSWNNYTFKGVVNNQGIEIRNPEDLEGAPEVMLYRKLNDTIRAQSVSKLA